MGSKNRPRDGKKRGGGKGKSISKVKKSNINHNKLAKKGKVKPSGSKPLFVEGGHLRERKMASAAKKKTLSKIELEDEKERKREYEKNKKRLEEEALEEMADMIDPDDLLFLKQKASSKSSEYELLSKVKGNMNENGILKPPLNRENAIDDYEMKALERQSAEENFKRTQEEMDGKKRPLLPIRTKEGWQQRSGKAIDSDSEDDSDTMHDESQDLENELDTPSVTSEKSNAYTNLNKPISVIDIVAKRRIIIHQAKIQIGSMASNFVEAPEERIQVLEKLIKLVSEDPTETLEILKTDDDKSTDIAFEDEIGIVPALHTVAKLAAISVCEILKDIIPNYKILDTSDNDKDTKLKKDTIKLQKYENGILSCTKNYLIKLERIVSKSKQNARMLKFGSQNLSLDSQRYAIKCTSELLKTHPYFNYMSDNVVNFLVPFLNASDRELRSIVSSSLKHVFVNDKRGEVTYAIVKKINHHLKTKTHEKIQPDMLEVLLSIPLYSLNEAYAQKESEMENKKNKKGKNEPYVSKKERKRLKASKKLEKELLEAKGEESTKTKLRYAADITNVLFAIYFRLLKTITDPSFLIKKGSHRTFRLLLLPLLSGLSKFGHLMSIEFFQDLLRTLISLLKANTREVTANEKDEITDSEVSMKPLLGNFETLKCVETVFSILSGQGDQLTIDPSTFYGHLSQTIAKLSITDSKAIETNTSSLDYPDKSNVYILACTVLRLAYIKRRKKVTKAAVTDIWKRVGIAALQSNGDGSSKLLDFLRECGNTAPTLWSNYLQVDDDDEIGGECAGPGMVGSMLATNLSVPQGGPSTLDEKLVHSINHYHLWELSLLATHVEASVTTAVEKIFKTSVSTSINASSKEIPNRCNQSKSRYELMLPNNVESASCILKSEEMGNEESFSILNENLPPMCINSRKRKRKSV